MKDDEYPERSKSLYEFMFAIDFHGSHTKTGNYFSDLSFSFITWRLIECIANGEVEVKDLDQSTLDSLCLAILPGGKTLFHYVYDKSDIIEAVFRRSLVDEGNVRSFRFSIPYLADIFGDCPIMLCRNNEAIPLKSINAFMKYLSGQGIDHHSRILYTSLGFICQQQVANFVDYIESRAQETSLTRIFTREELNTDNKTPGIITSDISICKESVRERLFTSGKAKEEISVYFIDMFALHEFSEEG